MASSTNGTLQQEESESLLKDGELDWDEAHATHQKQSSSVWSQRIKSLWIFLVHSAFVVLNVILLLVWTQSPLLKDCHANNKTEGGVWGKSACKLKTISSFSLKRPQNLSSCVIYWEGRT